MHLKSDNILLAVPYLEKALTLALTFLLLTSTNDKNWGVYASYLLLCGYCFHLISLGSNDFFIDMLEITWNQILLLKISAFLLVNFSLFLFGISTLPILFYTLYVVLDIEGLLIKLNRGHIVHRYRLARALTLFVTACIFIMEGQIFKPVYHSVIYCTCSIILITYFLYGQKVSSFKISRFQSKIFPSILHVSVISIATVFVLNGELLITSIYVETILYGEIDKLLRGTIMVTNLGVLFWPIISNSQQPDRINKTLVYVSTTLLAVYMFFVVPDFTSEVFFILLFGVITVVFSSRFLIFAKRRQFFKTKVFLYAVAITFIIEILILRVYHNATVISLIILLKYIFMYYCMKYTKK